MKYIKRKCNPIEDLLVSQKKKKNIGFVKNILIRVVANNYNQVYNKTLSKG